MALNGSSIFYAGTLYIQVGNVVDVLVALALGYTLGWAIQGLSNNNHLTTLPFKYPSCLAQPLAIIEDDDSSWADPLSTFPISHFYVIIFYF